MLANTQADTTNAEGQKWDLTAERPDLLLKVQCSDNTATLAYI